MSITFRIVLIIACVIASAYTLRKIRKSQLSVDDALFWIFFSVMLLVFSIFPEIAMFFAELLEIQSPSNFVFLVMLVILFYKLFKLAIDVSVQKHRLNNLIQRLAIMNYEKKREDIELIRSEIKHSNDKDEAQDEDNTEA